MVDIKPHVKIEQHPNPPYRSYHVTVELASADQHMVHFGHDEMGGSISGMKPKGVTRTLIERLTSIPGVNGGHIRGHEISVNIGQAFRWKDIGPIILGEIVNTVYPEILGKSIEISAELGWTYYTRNMDDGPDDVGQRSRSMEVLDHMEFEVSDPQVLDVESFLNSDALQKAKEKARSEDILEKQPF